MSIKRLFRGSLVGVLRGTVVLAAWFAAPPAAAIDLNTTVAFDISPQPLVTALIEFSKQAQVQVMSSGVELGEQQAPGVNGRYSISRALNILLAGTGLGYSAAGPNTIAVTRSASSERAAISPPSASPLQFAQAEPTESPKRESPQREESAGALTDVELGEVVVTGTHIRGGGAVGSRVEIIDRAEIDRSGHATTQQVLQSLPQNFQGGPNEDTFIGPAGSNVTAASSVNLRGLGAESTLVLVNGRRVPIAGANADFVDAASIPATAIDRIEVLADGASAIYGADAIGGVVNIILRQDYEGAETRARFGGVTDGSSNEFQFGQVLGNSWNTGQALLTYEYYERDALANVDRDFAANSDLRPLGGDNFSGLFNNPGNILNPFTGETAAIPAGQDGTSLTPADLIPGTVNFQNENEGRNLLHDQQRHSVFASFTQELNDSVDLFAEGRFTKRDFERSLTGQGAFLLVEPSNPFYVDPFGGLPFVFVQYNLINELGPLRSDGDTTTYNGVIGGGTDLGGDWHAELYGSYSKEDSTINQDGSVDFAAITAALADPDPATAFNPFGDGSNTNPATIAAIREAPSTNTTASELWSVNLTADGTIFHMPGGDAKLAVGADFQSQTFDTTTTVPGFPGEHFERDVTAAFAEFYLPLIDAGNRRPGLERLTLSVAGRFDDYDDVGNTTNPKLGLQWSPVQGLNIRGTWGTSFKAPNLPDRDETGNGNFVLELQDPASLSGTTFAVVQFGGNADLKNETATTWTAGLDYVPPALPGLSINLTYFDIEFEDRVTVPRNFSTVLIEEDRYSAVITRNPSQAELDAVCNVPEFDPILGDCTLPIGAIVDMRLNNTAITNVDGLDFNIGYGFETASIGRFDFRINGSYLMNFDEAFSTAAPLFSLVDTVNNPVDLRVRGTAAWSSANGVTATAFVNYADAYTNNVSIPERNIDSWTTVDFTLAFDTQDRLGAIGLNSTDFTLSALNLFDEDPPFVNNPQGVAYDPENADPLGRFLAINVTKNWGGQKNRR